MKRFDPPPLPLPSGIRSRFVDNGNGLTMHILEAGFEDDGRPCLLLLHGFPELAYSWRKVMLPLAAAGFHVVAPDQRGYGRTTGWCDRYDGDISAFGFFNLVKDALGLVFALGLQSVASVIGHDFGSPVAGCCALIRPDVFRSVAMMSAPFAGSPARFAVSPETPPETSIHDDLAALHPPRKHYQWYYSNRDADNDMRACEQGLSAFLRAYFHVKSADWKPNRPFTLASWSAAELAKLPTYYVMEYEKNMAQTVAPYTPSAEEIADCAWLSKSELGVYTAEFDRTGFQGGLQWYRCATSGMNAADLKLFAGRTIDVPATFIAGNRDWGVYQKPGDFEYMQRTLCAQFHDCDLIDGAGHWVQQEQPGAVSGALIAFLKRRVAT